MNITVIASATGSGAVFGGLLELPAAAAQANAPFWPPAWRCRSCGARLQGPRDTCPSCRAGPPLRRAAALSLLGALLLGALGASTGPRPVLGAQSVLVLGLLALSAVDLACLRLPRRLLYPTALAVGALELVAANGAWGRAADAALGAAAGAGLFGAIHLAHRSGMGVGDVRLAGLVGLGCGWLGLDALAVAFLVAVGSGALGGLAVMAATGQGRKTRVPFGPFLSLGAISVLLFHAQLVPLLLHP
jgi:leader peptidase (prepilin peptidase)/N-methyltransferase